MARPRKVKTLAQLEEGIESFMEEMELYNSMPTQAGLAAYLGFSSKQSLYDMKKRGAGWERAVGRFGLLTEHALIQRGRSIDIFQLKCNFGYNERASDSENSDREINIRIVGIDDQQ